MIKNPKKITKIIKMEKIIFYEPGNPNIENLFIRRLK